MPGAADVTVYHAGTAIQDGKLVTSGGRVLGVTATAATLPEALKKASRRCRRIHFDKLHRRSDIGAPCPCGNESTGGLNKNGLPHLCRKKARL